ncbi:MAG: ATP-binding protein [Anaerolineae bacterium]|nr:ATP-binding protein [Anaerolineae bacterium]
MFADVQRQLEPLFVEHHLKLAVEENAELVWADPARLRQVLLILLDNAMCYTPEGGSVTLRSKLHGDMVEIEVADTGVGIAPEHSRTCLIGFTMSIMVVARAREVD